MELSNPLFNNIEPIKRLVPYVVLYLSILVVLRLFIWPTAKRIREQSTLNVMLARLLRQFLFLFSVALLCAAVSFSLLSITGRDVELTVRRPMFDTGEFDIDALQMPSIPSISIGDAIPQVDGYTLTLLGIGVALLVVFALFQPWFGK